MTSTIAEARRSRRWSCVVTALCCALAVLWSPGAAGAGDGSSALGLPFATGESWSLLGGPHPWSGSSGTFSSLDLNGGSGNVRAAADGTVNFRSCSGGYLLMIDHANGWHTSYYHITNVAVTNGQHVSRGTYLGRIGTTTPCGGSASTSHVHFTVWKFTGTFNFANALGTNLNGVDIGGYTIHSGSAPYGGYLQRISTGAIVNRNGSVYNDGSVGSGGGEPKPPSDQLSDINGDDKADVWWYEDWNNGGSLTSFISNGESITYGAATSNLGLDGWTGAGDVNGDGKGDVVRWEPGSSSLRTYLSNGSVVALGGTTSGIGAPDWAGVGDINGDEKADLWWYEGWKDGGSLTSLISSGSTFTYGATSSGIGPPTWAGTGDTSPNIPSSADPHQRA